MVRAFLSVMIIGMSQPDYILNLTQDDGGVVHLHGDAAGLDTLIAKLSHIRAQIDQGICEHDHLKSADWGGDELSTKNGISAEGHTLVQHLKLFGWTDEWAEKHGFK
jgi:hypothetical protein